ncbi:hypothetical protein BDZ45DRAFT_423262 [Acephala macrosclerotiorum]|nr:hypothetical protein BDZ45DRAFT_423262 [Acephala macrosclerotiorum]
MCCSARRHQPSLCVRASPENQLSHEGRLYTGRGVVDERGLVDPARNADPVDEMEQQQEQQEEEDKDNDASSKSEHPPSLQGASVGKCRPLCENSVILDMEAIDPLQADVDLLDWEADSMAPMQRAQQLLPNRNPSPATSHDEAVCDSHSDNELNNTESDEDDEEPRPVKRKRPFSSQDGPMHKKPKHRLQQRSTRQHRPHSKPHRRSPKSHSPQDHGSRVTAVSSAKGRLPSPALSAPQTMDTEMPYDYSNLGGSFSDILPTLTEVTFRPHSPGCCFFKAIIQDGCDGRGVSFSQVARLIESVGHVGKIDDFTIKPIEQHSFLLTGFSRHTSSRLSSGTIVSPTVETSLVSDDAPSTTLQHSKAVDAGALPSEGSEPSSSDNESGLSDSDPDLSSDDDAYSSKRKQGSSTRMNIPWEPVDEQRLLAYKKEDKSWDWIFKKFPGRTRAAVRTRWTMVQHRVK